MARKTKEKSLTIHEALENLTTIAEIDPEDPYRVGIVKKHRFVIQDEGHSYQSIEWLTPESGLEILENVQNTYLAILDYLKELYSDGKTDWKNPKTKKGLQSMMALVGEAASKLDLLTEKVESQSDIKKVTETKEYKDLQEFYLNNISEKFEENLEGEEAWQEEWGEEDEKPPGLKDFETLKKDSEYELFYLKNSDGKSFFNTNLVRNIKLVCDFDESFEAPLEEDPLIRIITMKDRDLQGLASSILHSLQPLIQDFYKQRIRFKSSLLIKFLNKALMSLMLTANQRNLIQNTTNKNCLRYFLDFQKFLIAALTSVDYQKLLAYPPEKSDKVSCLLLNLIHRLCYEFFVRPPSIKQEMIGFIHRLMRKGEEVKKREKEKIFHSQSIWNQFIEDDEYIRTLLKCYPNGPLFKVLDVLRIKGELFFNPIRQENYPSGLYDLKVGNHEVNVFRMPSPTHQTIISQATVGEEFKGLLHFYEKEKKKHLLVNLQDRTSWKEHIRAQVLENLQRQAEYGANLDVISLAKDTDFYYQINDYLKEQTAEEFMGDFQEQIKSAEDCGFFFSKKFDRKNLEVFTDQLLEMLHNNFFKAKKKLSRMDRLDFIEIFYYFMTLKVIEVLKPDSISFTCKDAVDTGAVMSGAFFSFIKFLGKNQIDEKDQEFIRWLFYAPALLVRERSVDANRLNRALSALALMEKIMKENKAKVHKDLKALFTQSTLNNMSVFPNVRKE